jgi:hypothetical protein
MTNRIPEHSSASALRGLWFVFEQEGHSFAIWTSSITGKEEVYVDGQLVATRRKIALTSVHTVSAGGSEFTISLSTPHLAKGVFQATLARSGHVLQGWRTRFVTRRSTATSIISVVASAALIFAVLSRPAAPWYLVLGLLVVAVAPLVWSTAGRGYGYIVEPLSPAP